ncbi:hypothetical protein ACDZ28_13625 [Paenibacillus sp. RS8]|uniref:hypothetical protein n=1 Tax=Paenibacillus sp. RS8 TaxID=3242681 RepID=UPI0035BEB83A
MINIYELTCSTLEQLGHDVREQGSYAPNAKLPESFVTYQVIDDSPAGHADNKPTSLVWRIQVSLYSKRPAIKQGASETIKAVMLETGFMRVGGRDLPFLEATGHYGYTCDYRFYEMEE